MNHFLLLFTIITFCIPPVSGYAQDTVQSKDGKIVILFSDYTWKYLTLDSTENVPIKNIVDTACSSLVSINYDKMTGNQRVVGKPLTITNDNKSGLLFSTVLAKDGSLIYSIGVFGASSCIDNNSKINILFTDNTRMELLTDNKYNCDGRATVFFGDVFGKESELNNLLTKRIAAIRVWTMKLYVEVELSDIESNQFYYTINCLWNKSALKKQPSQPRRWGR